MGILRCHLGGQTQRGSQRSELIHFSVKHVADLLSVSSCGSRTRTQARPLAMLASLSLSLSAILMLNSCSLAGWRRNNHRAQHSFSMPDRKWPRQLLVIQPEIFVWVTYIMAQFIFYCNFDSTFAFFFSPSTSFSCCVGLVLKYCTRVFPFYAALYVHSTPV